MTESITMPEWIAATGLVLTAIGALVAATGVILSKEAAMMIGVARYVPEKPEDQLELPAVKSIIAQSKRAFWGLILVLVGTLAQLAPVVARLAG